MGETPLWRLNLPAMVYNALWRAGYRTVERVDAAGNKDLLAIAGFGRWSLQQVHHRLRAWRPDAHEDLPECITDLSLAGWWERMKAELTDRQSEVVWHYYGLGGERQTHKQIGARMGISTSSVREYRTIALCTLRYYSSLTPWQDAIRQASGLERVRRISRHQMECYLLAQGVETGGIDLQGFVLLIVAIGPAWGNL